MWSRTDPERGEVGLGRCAPWRLFPPPEAATPATHPTRRPPNPLAPRPVRGAYLSAARPLLLPGSTLGPGNVPGESGRGGNRPLNRSLSSLPSLAPAP